MAERQLDIITDTEDKFWYELDGVSENRQGPFDDFIILSEHLKSTLNETVEEKVDDMQRVPEQTRECRKHLDVPTDKEDNLPGSTDVQTDGKEAEIQKLKE
jgi:hypothetical protein